MVISYNEEHAEMCKRYGQPYKNEHSWSMYVRTSKKMGMTVIEYLDKLHKADQENQNGLSLLKKYKMEPITVHHLSILKRYANEQNKDLETYISDLSKKNSAHMQQCLSCGKSFEQTIQGIAPHCEHCVKIAKKNLDKHFVVSNAFLDSLDPHKCYCKYCLEQGVVTELPFNVHLNKFLNCPLHSSNIHAYCTRWDQKKRLWLNFRGKSPTSHAPSVMETVEIQQRHYLEDSKYTYLKLDEVEKHVKVVDDENGYFFISTLLGEEYLHHRESDIWIHRRVHLYTNCLECGKEVRVGYLVDYSSEQFEGHFCSNACHLAHESRREESRKFHSERMKSLTHIAGHCVHCGKWCEDLIIGLCRECGTHPNFVIRDGEEFALDHSTGKYVPKQELFDRMDKRIRDLTVSESLKPLLDIGFAIEPIVQYGDENWNRVQTDRLLFEKGYRWIVYVKLLHRHPFIVGKTATSGTVKEDGTVHTGIDFDFVVGDETNQDYFGQGRTFVRERYPELLYTDFDMILVKPCETEQEAYELERQIVRQFGLFES